MQIQAAGKLNGLEVTVAPDFTMGKTNREPEFLAKFPLGKVPAFEGADGTKLFESDAIAQYVAESGPAAGQLLGTTPAQRATIRQWISFAAGEVLDNVTRLILWRFGVAPYDEKTETTALERLQRAVGALETHLSSGRTWVATDDKLSLADLSLAGALVWGFAHVLDDDLRKNYPKTVEWYKRVLAEEGVKEVFGEPNFIAKRRTFEG